MSFRSLILLIFFSLALIWGCEREYVVSGDSTQLTFSTDTVSFDTVFTSVGSTTQNFRIYNPVQEDVVIEMVELAGGEESDFLLNVNGTPGNIISDVTVPGNDSLFVFVEVNVNPTSENTPFVISDSVFFYTRDHIYTVHLLAYGQNVIPLRQEVLKTQKFNSDKPYLIYDWVVVDSAETLTIDPGTRLYFHKDASLIVFGTLKVNGEVKEPVLFTSDRLDEWYKDKPGQWGYIQLMPYSRDHEINNAVIRNSTMGLVVDSVGIEKDHPPLYLNNVKIEHIASQGLIAQNSAIVASNSVFGDCGSASVALTVGGNYKFYHCTIANFFSWNYRSVPALVISNYYSDSDGLKFYSLESADFYNCIVYGKNDNEIKLDFRNEDDETLPGIANVRFNHSLVKIRDDARLAWADVFGAGVIFNEDPLFLESYQYNYQLDSLSVARDVGGVDVARNFPEDILGNSRLKDKGADLGAYERIDKQQ
ncbi:hypothetical protein ACT29H_08285 [Thermophagus sp. OGC60D27]|uniref:hypothetical protein n=1 Tax=Thermophagus sp. OGC60D27 TaxID=3458415 RepID=UPI0040380F4D